LELALSFVIPITLLSFKKVRLSPNWLYLASVISLFGFITNRLNVSLIGFETYVGHHYVPKWTEFSVTLMIIALGFALFRVAVQVFADLPQGRPGRTESSNRAIRHADSGAGAGACRELNQPGPAFCGQRRH